MNVGLVLNWLSHPEHRTTFLQPQFSQLENGHNVHLSAQCCIWHGGVVLRAVMLSWFYVKDCDLVSDCSGKP